jgi:hypothetical protein
MCPGKQFDTPDPGDSRDDEKDPGNTETSGPPGDANTLDTPSSPETADSPASTVAPATADSRNTDEAPQAQAQPAPHARGGIRRRDLLFVGGGVAAGVAATFGGIGAVHAISAANRASSGSTASGSTASSAPGYTVEHYASTMVSAPKLGVWRRSGATVSSDYLFVTPKTDQFSPMIYDSDGSPVWIDPTGATGTDLRVQQYQGESVLTYWSGRSNNGNGQGYGVILDGAYRTIGHVYAAAGLQSDLHEFELTDAGTALVTSYPVSSADLSSVGGPKKGYIFDCHIQELDVATGALLLGWRASDHIALTESYQPVAGTGDSIDNPYDPFHLNAISADGFTTTDALLLSSRHTHTIYSLDRATRAIRWRLGGKKSDFVVADDAKFAWQHHARRRSATEISMFDNHTLSPKGTSRGLLLTVDEAARTASLKAQYTYHDHVGTAMGSVQPLDNGNVLVGWGVQPYATEFTADGTAVWEASRLGTYTYRAQKSSWVGRPATVPDVHLDTDAAGHLRVAVSWNGATEVASWRVLSGASATALTPVATATRTGFETTVSIGTVSTGAAAHVRVDALDASGTVLASSPVVASRPTLSE